MIIGLSGYARSGKDTVASFLLEQGYQRRAFADLLRNAVYELDPLLDGGARVRNIVDLLGWEAAKVQYPEVRRLLQRMGTEAGRNLLGENVWVDATLAKMAPDTRYVITDVRFPNEADAIRARGGMIWRVNRPNFGPLNSHASEVSMDGYRCDFYINNNGDLEELRRQVESVFV